MRFRALIIAMLALAGVAACSGSPASSPKACEAAMRKDFQAALANPGAPPAREPAACRGLSPSEQRKIARRVMQGALS